MVSEGIHFLFFVCADRLALSTIRRTTVRYPIKESFMEFWAGVFILTAAVLAIAVALAAITSKRKQEIESRLKSLPDFNPTQYLIG